MKIAVLIRVYNRIEDLKYNLQIIRDTWKENRYYIIVVSNGENKGYNIPDESLPLIDKLIILKDNAGHRKGNSQLLIEGSKYIPSDCEYTLILEADTWMYGDRIISKYIGILSQSKELVWASADWYDKVFALATDFAIVKSDYIKKNDQLFDFELFPECHIANTLRDTNAKFVWITENMPVHVPSYIFGYPYTIKNERRFYTFLDSKIVTHHIEFLKKGIEQKKKHFNVVANTDYFKDVKTNCKLWIRFKMKFWHNLSNCFIKKSWFFSKKYRVIEK